MDSTKADPDGSWSTKLRQFLGLAFLISYTLLLAVAEILHVWMPTFVVEHPELKASIEILSEIAVMAILIAILVYLVMEHYTTLSRVPSEERLSSIIQQMHDKLIAEIAKPAEVRVYATAEETYTEIKRTIDRVNGAAVGEKQMKHGMLHRSAEGHEPDLKPVDGGSTAPIPAYFSAFDTIMTSCIRSKGRDRWFVRQFYNVTTLSRMSMIEERIKVDAEGFEVKAWCQPDLYPCLSPLVVGEEDAFLATLDSKNNRVGTAIHLRGREAVRFVTAYFDILWSYQSLTLRDELGVRGQDVQRLADLIIKRTQKR